MDRRPRLLDFDRLEQAVPGGRRCLRLLCAAAALVILGFALTTLAQIWHFVSGKAQVGGDLVLYLGATRSWLAGQSFYPPTEISRPFPVGDGSILYPPVAILLFLPWLDLPLWTFAAVPLCIVLTVVWYHRPAPWTWPLMAFCLAQTSVLVKVVYDNPVLWMAAAVALGTIGGGWAVAVLVKPTLLPFALVGARRRVWWGGLVALGAASRLFLPLWSQYLAVLANARDPRGILYSLGDAPLLLVPVLAFVGSQRKPIPRSFARWRAAGLSLVQAGRSRPASASGRRGPLRTPRRAVL